MPPYFERFLFLFEHSPQNLKDLSLFSLDVESVKEAGPTNRRLFKKCHSF
ncbi:hypothetical protein HDEF_1829 [Candidatus Hamiltonella defensa 5AT (Acyrthosiphon pisum)]|uniref:Uncharacterized protein n=1 Tax=Hamiltonella defensa subsp. Acyrthosiphon pisum (strain 5AT) TaxID=572265 RepID=C4K780_HAMD5|nr:hypothetical protein HDEF_1829 [Candidatus Hamiltonella defensa 5AT (Acyrthosiphon pisum)]